MGYGRSFVCSKCQKEYRAGWGVGFMLPEEYNLSCPKCGGAPDPGKQLGILWD